ncbi:CDP-glucose 4,6-dehydratase [Paenibacillus taichungensis]|uniref:CDP-glucose 4,6-dehydratase n=1 Tax=Paenibacillus taichungensis TaxID=484184 RepID=A0A329QE59_9BACL|nr:CDP-glucose 4,6-dehydratase [Paenibacillus taichungensis]RAW09979.1 CDP-glucose 4,6-dehydratase [Paenibacillus taichungensis]
MEGLVSSIEHCSFWKDKNVLVTGHTGFKGAWLSSILLNAGANVTGYSLEASEKLNIYNAIGISKDINSSIGDIRDMQRLQKTLNESKPDIVFHLAAQPIVRDSYTDPVSTFDINIMGTVNLLECIRKSKSVRSFVNITTDKVYENQESMWGYRENDRLCGHDPYSNSKSCSELVTFSYKNSYFTNGDTAAISTARSGNVVGGGDFSKDRIIPDCVRAAQNNKVILVRNPYSVRPYQHVLDCLSGYVLLAQKQYENKLKYEGSYNFGPDNNESINTSLLVGKFCEAWGSGLKWVSNALEGPHETGTLKLDCSKAHTVLGWKPLFNIDQSMHKTVEWYKSFVNGDNCDTVTMKQVREYFV